MLISIVKNKNTTKLALRDVKKVQLILTCEKMKRIEEIIALLKCFKAKTDKLGAQDDITISLIIPTFEYFRNALKEVNQGESSMIKSMKAHMLIKLDSRYSEDQKEYLSECSFLDPRFKKRCSYLYDGFY